MATMNMIEAINNAMDDALERDIAVTIFGQDVGYFGGVFRATEGLQAKYGASRVFDAPIAEGGIVAVAVGMGAYGKRPVVEIQFADYIYPAADQLISEAARLRYRTGGEWWSPITVRSRSEEHTSELQSLMRISYAVFCLKSKTNTKRIHNTEQQ